MAGLYQHHDPDAEQNASRDADQKSVKEFSFHRGDHGEPDAPLLIIEGDIEAFRRSRILPEKRGPRHGSRAAPARNVRL